MHAQALKLPDPANEDAPGAEAASRAVREIAERFGKLSAEITDMSGRIGDVNAELDRQTDGLHRMVASVDQVSRSNKAIQHSAEAAQEAASVVKSGLERVTGAVRQGLNAAQNDIAELSDGAQSISQALSEAVSRAHKVREASEAIQTITREIQLLSINAGVEAARSGVAGRGFAVIAAAVKQLAEQTRDATSASAKQLEALVATVDQLAKQSKANAQAARRASEESQGISQQIGELDHFGRSVVGLIGEIDSISIPARENAVAFAQVGDELRDLVAGVDQSGRNLEVAARRGASLVSTSEAILGAIAGSGVRTPQSDMIEIAVEAAATISDLFEQAVAKGEVGLAELFDEAYRPVPGSDPQQFLSRFTALTDRLLPPVQERLLTVNKRIVFCAAIDRNGYLPTHNRKYSQPQGSDPVWNNANCRNRRIFNDRTGLAAARNQKPFLLQTYRRDMGGGNFLVMEDLSAPIFVRGRHWGGVRFGLSV
ncbi:methyl-accepting chemotaxis protein [Bosea vestrisii]|uniref:methyl-accepting chemotaxis protein n=1 Tax=Bosea vestrisii TaxID=151416 RepID=UPI0024DF681A|nr:methyl-accepting chemotaxis protein [Bosea vestrisii]WID97853.1 methyl-accepting chemotaxis protein [Bosea vestrisii]